MIDSSKSAPTVLDDVTVVMAAYNAEGTIAASIESALNNLACQIIVVDDGSTDQTANIARELGADVVSQPNAGAAHARRTGLNLVQTSYVVILDSDDLLTPATRQLVQLISAHPEAAVVGGRIRIRTSDGHLRGVGPSPAARFSTVDLLKSPSSPWPPSAAIWRVDSLRKSSKLPIPSLNPRFAEDYELLLRASMVGSVLSIPEITCLYQSFGGKSSVAAVSALKSAELIRQHYATALDISVTEWGVQKIHEDAAWRLFRARSAEFGLRRALMLSVESPSQFVLVTMACFRRSYRRCRGALRTTSA